MLYGGDGIRSVVVSRTATRRKRRWRSDSSFSPERCIPPRRPVSADLNLHTVGNRLRPRADRRSLRHHQAYQRGAGRRRVISLSGVRKCGGRGQRTESAAR